MVRVFELMQLQPAFAKCSMHWYEWPKSGKHECICLPSYVMPLGMVVRPENGHMQYGHNLARLISVSIFSMHLRIPNLYTASSFPTGAASPSTQRCKSQSFFRGEIYSLS